MPQAKSFTFDTYKINTKRSVITFTYKVELGYGIKKTFTDKLSFPAISKDQWEKIPKDALEPALQALLIMVGINYWCAFPTKNIRINGFTLSREQAQFWNSLYLDGLGEFFYDMKMDFQDLINFPYDENYQAPIPPKFDLRERSLLLNGAGKDSILSAEILKASNTPFDFFAFAPTPAHKRIAKIANAETIEVTRSRDPLLEIIMTYSGISNSYPSVSTFTFVAVLLAEVLGYKSIIFSNERSADFGNLTYRGLEVNHQWCKSSEAEKLVNDYIQRFITPDISTKSLLRKYSELEIVRQFVQYPQYLHQVTSCNTYFWLHPLEQRLLRKSYWCKGCPKCVFMFACFSAYLPKKELVSIFGADLYEKKRLLRSIRRILGIEGFKPLDCVGEPEEMILAMHMASKGKEYEGELAMQLFEKHFSNYDFGKIEKSVFEIK